MKQTDKTHYEFESYMRLSRWACYYKQIKTTLSLRPEKVLEVGPGDGLFGWYMKKNGVEYVSADHADDIQSDLKVNLGFEDIPAEENSFDVVCAFQVLEHIPYEKFEYAVKELHRVSKSYVFLDIPQHGFHIQFAFKVPLLRYFHFHFVLPRPTKHEFDGLHYWEIGKRGYPPSKIRQVLEKFFTIEQEFSIYQNPGERFYVLKKL